LLPGKQPYLLLATTDEPGAERARCSNCSSSINWRASRCRRLREDGGAEICSAYRGAGADALNARIRKNLKFGRRRHGLSESRS